MKLPVVIFASLGFLVAFSFARLDYLYKTHGLCHGFAMYRGYSSLLGRSITDESIVLGINADFISVPAGGISIIQFT